LVLARFIDPCWGDEVVSVAFAIDCAREVPAYVASLRLLTGAGIRTPLGRTQWARSGEAVLKALHAFGTGGAGVFPECQI